MTEVEFLKDLVIRASKLITNEVVVKVKDDKGDLVTNLIMKLKILSTAKSKRIIQILI